MDCRDRRAAAGPTCEDGQPYLGNPAEQLLERHDKSDFELRTQDKIGDNRG
jgi:hypothetical protein